MRVGNGNSNGNGAIGHVIISSVLCCCCFCCFCCLYPLPIGEKGFITLCQTIIKQEGGIDDPTKATSIFLISINSMISKIYKLGLPTLVTICVIITCRSSFLFLNFATPSFNPLNRLKPNCKGKCKYRSFIFNVQNIYCSSNDFIKFD